MSSKRRKYAEEYVQFGFTYFTYHDGSQCSQRMIWQAKLNNSSLAPAKLKEHFLKMYGKGKHKNTTQAEFKTKRAGFDKKPTQRAYGFVPIDKSTLTAS